MRVLLDTCVLCEIQKPQGEPAVKQAVTDILDENLFISVISIGEIVKGIELLSACKRKTELQIWVHGLENNYSESILGIDLETVQIWGILTTAAQKIGKTLPVSDGLIAATAKRHGLYIMTRNVSDFECTGILIVNPWSDK